MFFTWRFRVNIPFILVFNKGLDWLTQPVCWLISSNLNFNLTLDDLSSGIQTSLRIFNRKDIFCFFTVAKSLSHVVQVSYLSILIRPPRHQKWTEIFFSWRFPSCTSFKDFFWTVPTICCQITINKFKACFCWIIGSIIFCKISNKICCFLCEWISWCAWKGTIFIKIKDLTIYSNGKVFLVWSIF